MENARRNKKFGGLNIMTSTRLQNKILKIHVRKIILKPWLTQMNAVEIEVIKDLTEKEKDEVCSGIRRAFSKCISNTFRNPTLEEIKQEISEYDPLLVNKIISCKFC